MDEQEQFLLLRGQHGLSNLLPRAPPFDVGARKSE
jgi:hypothetical protein